MKNGNVKNWAEEREESKKEDAKNTLYKNGSFVVKCWHQQGEGSWFQQQSHGGNWVLLKRQHSVLSQQEMLQKSSNILCWPSFSLAVAISIRLCTCASQARASSCLCWGVENRGLRSQRSITFKNKPTENKCYYIFLHSLNAFWFLSQYARCCFIWRENQPHSKHPFRCFLSHGLHVLKDFISQTAFDKQVIFWFHQMYGPKLFTGIFSLLLKFQHIVPR